MGAFADSLFAILMSWVRALVNSIWALFTSERTTVLEFLGKNWLGIVVVLVAVGLVVDWFIWLLRWRPYTLWAQRARRLLRIAPVQGEEEEEDDDVSSFEEEMLAGGNQDVLDSGEALDDDENWLPERPVFDEEEEDAVIQRAQDVPDEELGLYPGMRYDDKVQRTPAAMDGTRRFGAVHQEGPGAAEVNRRRAEIDAWQQQMQEEARAERERRMEQMRRAEEERLAEEARLEAEARAAEEERLAQAAYERELEEYQRQREIYEQELAQYQRDMAAYEAALAAQQAQEETAQELAPAVRGGRSRTRRRAVTYSDMVEGETVEELPDTPNWPQMDKAVSDAKKEASAPKKQNGFIGRVAHLIEPEQEEITGVGALPPRVDPHQAYKPAARPGEQRKRRKE